MYCRRAIEVENILLKTYVLVIHIVASFHEVTVVKKNCIHFALNDFPQRSVYFVKIGTICISDLGSFSFLVQRILMKELREVTTLLSKTV